MKLVYKICLEVLVANGSEPVSNLAWLIPLFEKS